MCVSKTAGSHALVQTFDHPPSGSSTKHCFRLSWWFEPPLPVHAPSTGADVVTKAKDTIAVLFMPIHKPVILRALTTQRRPPGLNLLWPIPLRPIHSSPLPGRFGPDYEASTSHASLIPACFSSSSRTPMPRRPSGTLSRQPPPPSVPLSRPRRSAGKGAPVSPDASVSPPCPHAPWPSVPPVPRRWLRLSPPAQRCPSGEIVDSARTPVRERGPAS